MSHLVEGVEEPAGDVEGSHASGGGPDQHGRRTLGAGTEDGCQGLPEPPATIRTAISVRTKH